MARFRPMTISPVASSPSDLQAVCQVIEDVFLPGHFFLPAAATFTWQTGKAEEIPWEIFRGRLLDPAHSRERRTFLSWNLWSEPTASQPLLSIKLDMHQGQVHVTRGLLCRVWEGYDEGNNVILSRETCRWVPELVGSITLADYATLADLTDELICLLWQGVVGTSRLPLHSLETPLPGFSLGRLGYVYRPGCDDATPPMRSVAELITLGLQPGLNWREKAKLLESAVRASADVDTAPVFAARWQHIGHSSRDLGRLWRTVINEVSLSPWTDFVPRVLAWWDVLAEVRVFSRDDQVDFLSHVLRQLGRHLTAYDLVVFHHRGANYPDALLLDAVVGELLNLLERTPALFDGPTARPRRRGLLHGCLVRRFYEGHAIPDAPTSPGENARVLPAPFEPVPEEQLVQPAQRTKLLFTDRPLGALLGVQARNVLASSLDDLRDPVELAQLGTALFIDRPFGHGKAPGEPDQTPLLAHEVCSPTLVRKRLLELTDMADELGLGEAAFLAGLGHNIQLAGISLDQVADAGRPIVALADARQVADDFVVLRTLAGGLADLFDQLDFGPLRQQFALDFLDDKYVLCRNAQTAGHPLTFWDRHGRKRLECETIGPGFRRRAGVELPSGGLRVLRVWQLVGETLREHNLRAKQCVVPFKK